MKSLISVIMPYFNAGKYIQDSIDSLVAQSYQNWELIVVDDCSDIENAEILNKVALSDHRIRVLRLEKNSGAAVARNRAIESANGRYIAFLDCDDLWKPSKLEKQILFMQQNSVALSYSAYDRVDVNGIRIGHVGVPERVSYSDLLKVCSIGCLTAIYDTEVLGKVFMPLIRKRQDLGLWLKILKEVPFAYGVTESLAEYRVRPDSISANKRVAASYTWKLYRGVEQLPLYKTIYYFSHYAVNGVLRTKFPSIARKLGVLK